MIEVVNSKDLHSIHFAFSFMPPKRKSRKRERCGRPEASAPAIPSDIQNQIDNAWKSVSPANGMCYCLEGNRDAIALPNLKPLSTKLLYCTVLYFLLYCTSGRIGISQAKDAMNASLNLHAEKCDFPRGDADIDREAFWKIAAEKFVQKRNASLAFSLFDKDKKGLVLLEDVQRVATELGESYSTEEIEEMVNEADHSGEGLLTLEDFVGIAARIGL